MFNMLLCQYSVIVSGEFSYGTPLKNIKENTAVAKHLLYKVPVQSGYKQQRFELRSCFGGIKVQSGVVIFYIQCY